MREKLIELENDARMNAHWHGAKNQIEYVVDYLIANGVTIPVRCGECEHYTPVEGGKPLCALHSIAVAYDDFCSCGERRTDV